MPGNQTTTKALPHLFRTEYAKMVAVLCRHFGLKQIEVAEDIASDTFLKASEVWALDGLPPDPTAWLYAVAKNRTRDYFRHKAVVEKSSLNLEPLTEPAVEFDIEVEPDIISDSHLAMLFAVCNPANPDEANISLALQVVCGFNLKEIANAFLTKTETIKKRLVRARSNLRKNNFEIRTLAEDHILARQSIVLKTLYLLFNEGYYSRTNDKAIRKELCAEALRLVVLLTENNRTNTAETNALLSLMCFQSSRLEARMADNGDTILFDDQDRTLWDTSLIEKGNYYLVAACHGNDLSAYHLEAAIAYWHCAPPSDKKWKHILQLYDELIAIHPSPVRALNRGFALSRVYGANVTIPEVERLRFEQRCDYHALLGYLYSKVDPVKAETHYTHAIELTESELEKRTFAKAIEQLKSKG